MNRIPVIDMTATGINITRLRVNAGLTVKDLQDIFGFSTPQAIYKCRQECEKPQIIDPKRKRRIAAGSGTPSRSSSWRL